MRVCLRICLLCLACLYSGCATWSYERLPKGEIEGQLTLIWVGPDQFIYRPDPERPFRFKRANGEIIEPRSVYTDGGSIPRPLWILRGYSPWAFGPAYVAHDWLFTAHHCDYPEAKNHSVFTAADVLSECIKTLMESKPEMRQYMRNPSLLYTIDRAVRSKIAQDLWNNGACQKPPAALMSAANFARPLTRSERQRLPSIMIQTFDFDTKRDSVRRGSN
jgi:hypothetical protein